MLTEESPSHSQAKRGPTIASNRSVNSTTNDSRTKFDKQPMGFTELSGKRLRSTNRRRFDWRKTNACWSTDAAME